MLDRSTRELIDTERYPVESLESERGRELVEGCRASVEDHALCLLPGFVPSEIVQQMVKETAPAIGEGFPFENQRPAYADDGNRWSTDHPRGMLHHCRYRQILNYQISNDALIRRLYLWPALTEFIRQVIRAPALFQSACPHFALTLQISDAGDCNGWHFDGNDFVVSLLLQAPDSGGEFEYAANIRNYDDQNYPGVARVFSDPDTYAERVALTSGTFALFEGDQSIHRVRPVGKTRAPRVIALLSYDRRPDQIYPQAEVDRIRGYTR